MKYNEIQAAMNKKVILLIALLALPLLSPAPVRAWELVGDSLQPVGLPTRSQGIPQPLQMDLDEDGEKETLELNNGQARIVSGIHLRWRSPIGWEVRQASLGDLNHDGSVEAVLLVWRPFKPWPVDRWLPRGGRIDRFQNDRGKSCQIILIGWSKGAFRERWAGSALAEPVSTFGLADLNHDGKVELVTLDSTYSASPSAAASVLKVWEWNGFGFSLVSKVQGIFSNLRVVRTNEGHVILLTP